MDVSIAAVENTLLSENDVGQFSDRLFGSNGKVEIDPEEIFEDADGEDEVEEPEERCKLCGKSCYCANELMTDHIKRCLTTMKSSKKPCKQSALTDFRRCLWKAPSFLGHLLQREILRRRILPRFEIIQLPAILLRELPRPSSSR